ncbi:hypothetical protein JH06_5044 [Blastocystis sp. subtype 4]|uniref:hypothetical protein n=1 Tax=Blastocystis sp. subtype 4 TaxID=944170 RepID=UPI000711C705|nr:hypothetical protein JH06_5044 [Blastocystis sp. subtype 4]KNB42244.1 hypothetical protein JH06_5044 [Blastocystis sp. subtype 4]|eukprot:XP_014525687.1 hypothetical protein JH06_5044 [Blastocystis sp. subtype 4]
MSGELFINSKPFIIADSLQCIDWSIVDAIFVSSIDSYLLLPIILRDTSFCGAIYVPSSLDFIGKEICLSLASDSVSTEKSSHLTSLLQCLPVFRDSDFCGYSMMTLEDINRVTNNVTRVSYGEEIHRDLTVCVRCVCDGHDIASCGWIFRNECGTCPIHNDIGFIPSDQLPITSITQPCSVDEIVTCKNLILGTSYKSAQGEIHGLDGAKAFLQQCRNENRVVLLICGIRALLLELLEYVLSGASGHGKSSSVLFLDDTGNHQSKALSAYRTYPECLSEYVKHNVFAGVPPFLCFDSHSCDIVFSSTSPRSRSFHLIVYSSVSMYSSFPSYLFNQYEGLEVLVADDQMDINRLTPFLPDSTHIHQMTYPDTSSDFLNLVHANNNAVIRVGHNDDTKCQNLNTGDSISLDMSDDDTVEVVVQSVESRTRKRQFIDISHGLYKVKSLGDGDLEVVSPVIHFPLSTNEDSVAERMKCLQKRFDENSICYELVSECVISIPSYSSVLKLEKDSITIEQSSFDDSKRVELIQFLRSM